MEEAAGTEDTDPSLEVDEVVMRGSPGKPNLLATPSTPADCDHLPLTTDPAHDL